MFQDFQWQPPATLSLPEMSTPIGRRRTHTVESVQKCQEHAAGLKQRLYYETQVMNTTAVRPHSRYGMSGRLLMLSYIHCSVVSSILQLPHSLYLLLFSFTLASQLYVYFIFPTFSHGMRRPMSASFPFTSGSNDGATRQRPSTAGTSAHSDRSTRYSLFHSLVTVILHYIRLISFMSIYIQNSICKSYPFISCCIGHIIISD